MNNWIARHARRRLNDLSSPSGSSLVKSGVALFLLLLVWWQVSEWYQVRLLAEGRSQAASDVSLRANALSAALNRRLALLDGLYAYALAEPSSQDFEKNFETFASGLYGSTTDIRNIAVAPGNVMQYVYPRDGNEKVLGYNPLHDPRPEIRAAAERAIRTRRVVLSGPSELIQGGTGIIARQAVSKDGIDWGLVTIVVDLQPILQKGGLDKPTDGLTLALKDTDGNVFFGPAHVFQDRPVTSLIELPEGNWVLAGLPDGGWLASIRGRMLVFHGAGLTIILLLTGLIYSSTNNQARLRQAVYQRTSDLLHANERLQMDFAELERMDSALRASEAQYRGIFEAVNDGLFINDLHGNLVDFNPAACRMHGYTAQEFRHIQPPQFIHPDSHDIFRIYMDKASAGEKYRTRAVDVRKDGKPIHVEVVGSPFTFRGQPHVLGVVRDVSEEVQAYQLLEQRVAERTHELSTLLDISRNLTSTLDLEPLLGLILEQLKAVVDYDGASILTLDGDAFRVRAYRGLVPLAEAMQVKFSIREGFGQEILSCRRPTLISDVHSQTPEAQTVLASALEQVDNAYLYMRSWMGVPLVVKDQVIGLLALHHAEPDYFSHSQAELALAFSSQAAIAIENARLYEQAQSLAALQERQKLARELHDSVSQALYGIALGAQTAQSLLNRQPVNPEALKGPLDYVLSLAEAGLTEMRALIFELRPESIEVEGLVAALTKQAAALSARHQITVETAFEPEPPLPLEAKHALFRIAQEALHNIVKHAQASQVELGLEESNGFIRLAIKDDGLGFDTHGLFPGHFGLHSMRERAERLGGIFQVESSPRAGTRILVEVPLG